jgi:tetratricopeptide (TPR) repeat protein
MRRILLALAMLAVLLAATKGAEARHGHGHWHGHRHGHWHGHGHGHWHGHGWGGFHGGWGHRYSHGFGWGGWGGSAISIGYYPYASYGCYSPYYAYRPSYLYGGYGYPAYYPPAIGYYGFYGSTYNPSANFLATNNQASPTVAALVLDLLKRNQNNVAVARPEIAADAAAQPVKVERPALPLTNIVQRRKADQQISTGDMLFREQNFHAALQRYKTAAQLAPDMAEAYWRQGHALIATANYELASGAFKRALALDPNTGREGFTLAKLYADAELTKTAHIEGLAGWALTRGESSDPYFLMAVTLYYDGQADRAAPFFARAAQISGVAGGHIAAFEGGGANLAAPVAANQPAPQPEIPIGALFEI